MISDVQIDGQSIGPVMYATIPNVNANHTISASFAAFDQVTASNVSTEITGDTRILLFGPSASTIRRHLYQIIDAESPPNSFNITIGVPATNASDSLLEAYHSDRYTPDEPNLLLNKIAEGWDYIVPIDLADYQARYPELHMEGVRRIHNRAWFHGGQARLILPMLWSGSYTTTTFAEHAYRIGNSFRVPVLPVGYAWQEMVDSHGSATSYEYLFACTLYAQLFEKQPPATGETDKDTAGSVAWAAWQAEKATTHYTGAYSGTSTPVAWTGGRSYFFGSSTMDRSVRQMSNRISQYDPGVGSMDIDTAYYFSDAAASGSDVRDDLSSRNYDYMWVQPKAADPYAILNTYVRGEFGEDPYFVFYNRYQDTTAGVNAEQSAGMALLELLGAVQDNEDTTNNPNQKSRAPQTHVGWGRVWEERTDIQMMESDLLHASGPIMSMFAAQAYALFTGRDASQYGTWGYSDPTMVEQSGYARRVGYETIMQLGYLDIHEPYDHPQYDDPIFNQNSIFAPNQTPVAKDDPPGIGGSVEYYTIKSNERFVLPAPGVLANDSSPHLTAILQTPPSKGTVKLEADGSLAYTPGTNTEYQDEFTYVVSDGTNQSAPATVRIWTSGENPPIKPDNAMIVQPRLTSHTMLWDDESSNEDGFLIERSLDDGDTWTLAGMVAAGETLYTDTGLTCGTEYAYRVASFNTGGKRYDSDSWIAGSYNVYTATAECPWPKAPTSLTVTQTSTVSATLNWTDNSPKEDGTAIERSFLSDAGWAQVGTVVTDVVTYDDTGLTCDTAYYYRVRAHNAGGYSGYSDVASDRTSACAAGVPPTPSSLTETLTAYTAITLTWQSSVSETTIFGIERSPDGQAWSQVGTMTHTVPAPHIIDVSLGSTEVVSLTYTDTGLDEGTIYYYRVRAYNANGGSGYSNAIQAQTTSYSVYLPLVLNNSDGSPPLYSISGRVASESSGMEKITISAGDGLTATTDIAGYYTLEGLPAGSYTLTPSKTGWAFSPISATITVPPDASEVNFEGTNYQLGLFEIFIDPAGTPDQQAASVIENQLVPEYADQPILILEHDYDTGGERWLLWEEIYGDASSATSPMAMVVSAVTATEGTEAAAAGYYTKYKAMIDSFFVDNNDYAWIDIQADALRVGDTVSCTIQVTAYEQYWYSNQSPLWVIVYEESSSGPISGRLTRRFVRATAMERITINLDRGESETYYLGTEALSGVDWSALHAVVLVQDQWGTGTIYGNQQVISIPVTQ